MLNYFLKILEDDIHKRQAMLREDPMREDADKIERVLNRRMRTYVLLANYKDKRNSRFKDY